MPRTSPSSLTPHSPPPPAAPPAAAASLHLQTHPARPFPALPLESPGPGGSVGFSLPSLPVCAPPGSRGCPCGTHVTVFLLRQHRSQVLMIRPPLQTHPAYGLGYVALRHIHPPVPAWRAGQGLPSAWGACLRPGRSDSVSSGLSSSVTSSASFLPLAEAVPSPVSALGSGCVGLW